ncbi:MAG: DNRLRE domain-containing protein [Bacteroidota bacterium]
MKTTIIFIILFICYIAISAQTTTTIKLNSITGKDIFVWDYLPDASPTNSDELSVYAWTYQGTPTIRRVLLRFNLSMIPQFSTILDAQLKMFNYPNAPSTWGEHSQLSGTNEFYINRITSVWNEISATWNNQPSVTIQNQVLVPPSIDPHQNYVISVTDLIQDIVDLPTNENFGFRLKLVTEDYYRSLIFASSENPDTSLSPELVVVWTKDSVESICNVELFDNFYLYPNPASDLVYFKTDNIDNLASIQIFDLNFRLVKNITMSSNSMIDVSNLTQGVYYIRLIFYDNIQTKKLVIIR